MRSLGRAWAGLVHEVMGSPFFARPHAHGHFPSIAQLPPLTTSLCTSSDCDHPSGNRSISCPRESPDSSPTSGSSAERATSLSPSLIFIYDTWVVFPHLLRWRRPPPSVGRPGRPLSITVFLAAAENGTAAADPAAARRLQRARGKGGGALARSRVATCESAVGEQIAERKEERPRE